MQNSKQAWPANTGTIRHLIAGWIDTPAGGIPQISTRLTAKDNLGRIRVRLNIGRMNYAVEPGLYAVGNPGEDSHVFVSANYKLSFDRLRIELNNIDAWILVLDTKGINVWCAAGKGTFGTDEVINRIEQTNLERAVSHRKLIVPQLGAPGVAAHAVKKRSGFTIIYGPVRAKDIPAFLEAGMKAAPAMRRVRFDVLDRMVMVPVEFVLWSKYAVLIMLTLILIGGLEHGGYSPDTALALAPTVVLFVLLASIAGGVLAPILLPWLPGRAFSLKGAITGFLFPVCLLAFGWITMNGPRELLQAFAWLLLIPSISSFLAMNFTGASTFTSLSGVKYEMRFALPVQITAFTIGIGVWIAAGIVR